MKTSSVQLTQLCSSKSGQEPGGKDREKSARLLGHRVTCKDLW